MVNVIFIKENKNNEIDDYFNNFDLLSFNDKYNSDFIEILNSFEFINFININKFFEDNEKNKTKLLLKDNNDIEEKILKLINLNFNYESKKIFNTIDFFTKDDLIFQIIYDQNIIKNNDNLNLIGSILCCNEVYIFGQILIICYSKTEKNLVNININILADLISNYYFFYMINYNIKTKKINILKKINYSSIFMNKKYKIIENYLLYTEDDDNFHILNLKVNEENINSTNILQCDLLGIFQDCQSLDDLNSNIYIIDKLYNKFIE